MREPSSLRCTCTAKMLTWLCSMSSAIAVRQVDERPRRDVFEHERLVGRADLLDLVHQAGGDVLAVAIGDHRHALVRLDVEADANRVARAGRKFLIERGQHLLNSN